MSVIGMGLASSTKAAEDRTKLKGIVVKLSVVTSEDFRCQ